MLQIVYETLKDIQEHKGMQKSGEHKPTAPVGFKLSSYDRTPAIGRDLFYPYKVETNMLCTIFIFKQLTRKVFWFKAGTRINGMDVDAREVLSTKVNTTMKLR